jgi:hypothetical protein
MRMAAWSGPPRGTRASGPSLRLEFRPLEVPLRPNSPRYCCYTPAQEFLGGARGVVRLLPEGLGGQLFDTAIVVILAVTIVRDQPALSGSLDFRNAIVKSVTAG